MTLCSSIFSVSAFAKFSGLWSCPVEYRVYWLRVITHELDAMLRDTHRTKVAASHRLNLDEAVQELAVVFCVAVRQLNLTIPVEFKVLVISCSHIFVARHLGVSVYWRFVLYCTYCYGIVAY